MDRQRTLPIINRNLLVRDVVFRIDKSSIVSKEFFFLSLPRRVILGANEFGKIVLHIKQKGFAGIVWKLFLNRCKGANPFLPKDIKNSCYGRLGIKIEPIAKGVVVIESRERINCSYV